MRIHEVCKICGLTKKAVEYYERQGLLRPQTDGNGYRNYSAEDAAVLKEISVLRKLDIGIADIKAIVSSADKCGALADCKAKMEARMQKAAAQFDCLNYLLDNRYDVEGSIGYIESKLGDNYLTIREKLAQAFPGGYGMFLCLHFGRFLGGKTDSGDKAAAYREIVAFLDGLKDMGIPAELEEYLSEALSQDGEALRRIDDGLHEAVNDYQAFMEKNREAVERYLEYRDSGEFQSSPAYKMKQYLLKFLNSSGYYDIFIPNMKVLSDSYREYSEKIGKANELFLREYPQAEKLL